MNAENARGSKTAKMLYRPFGLAGSLLGGLVAGMLFKRVWRIAAPSGHDDPPKSLESEYPLREILIAAAIQGALFALVKAIIDRGSARAFQHWTGEWPGD